jgi:hypothetical protein
VETTGWERIQAESDRLLGLARRRAAGRYAAETVVEALGAVLQGACWATGALIVVRLVKR